MAYRLERTESTTKGLRRIAGKALKSAREELRRDPAPSDSAIYEARKRLKKARAIVELIDTDKGKGLSGCRRLIRRVNRTLSSLRDADAMLEILTKVREASPDLFSEHTFARLRQRLALHKQEAFDVAKRDGAWRRVDKALRALRRAAADWTPRHRGFGAFARAIRDAHRRGRKAMARAEETQAASDFHEWRKEMKTLWYQLRLLEACGGGVRRDVAALHEAETALGDEHNAAVLCAELAKDATVCGGAADVDRMRLAADRFQCAVRKKAVDAARSVYAKRPRAYARNLEQAWRGWRRSPASEERGTPARRSAA